METCCELSFNAIDYLTLHSNSSERCAPWLDALHTAASCTILGKACYNDPSTANRRSRSQPPEIELSKKRSIHSVASSTLPPNAWGTHTNLPSPAAQVKRTKQNPDTGLDDKSFGPGIGLAITSDGFQESSFPLDGSENSIVGTSDLYAHSSNDKALMSPINFEAQHDGSQTTTARTICMHASKYAWYPPMNPFDGQSKWTQLCAQGPHRKLSYGGFSKPRSLHRATGSDALHRQACLSQEHDDFDLSTDGEEPQNPNRRSYKPRLWLNTGDDDDGSREIQSIEDREAFELGDSPEQAVIEHAITAASSPSKPRVIDISPSSSIRTLASINKLVAQNEEQSSYYPRTPPMSCATPYNTCPNIPKHDKKTESFELMKARGGQWPPTPPKTPGSTPTVRQIPLAATSTNRPGTPRPPRTPGPQLSESTAWILAELENEITSNAPLTMDSPVILQIRLPVLERTIPRSTPPTLPLRRYSTMKGPLSSHPSSSPFSTPSQSKTLLSLDTVPLSPTLRTLKTIFPFANLSFLSSLQATLLALQHLRTIKLAYAPLLTTNPSSSYDPAPSFETTYIPCKARAMLGLSPPPARPALPPNWVKPMGVGWAERVQRLERGLREEVGQLVEAAMAAGEVEEAICGGGEGMPETLARAVGEVVRMGEEGRRTGAVGMSGEGMGW